MISTFQTSKEFSRRTLESLAGSCQGPGRVWSGPLLTMIGLSDVSDEICYVYCWLLTVLLSDSLWEGGGGGRSASDGADFALTPQAGPVETLGSWRMQPRHRWTGEISFSSSREKYYFQARGKSWINRSGPLRLYSARRRVRDRYYCLKRTISRKGLWPRPEDCANWLQDCLLNCDLFETYRRGFRTENLFYDIDIGWIQ